MPLEFRNNPPSKEQYLALFESTGWNSEYRASADQLAQALANSQFILASYDGERLIGFGRVVTDGVLHAIIYDMIVTPQYQYRGIGTTILQRLIQRCRAANIRDIQLFCAQGRRPFYERNGFVPRADDAPGMQYMGGRVA